MAKQNDNTLMIAGLAVAGFLIYSSIKKNDPVKAPLQASYPLNDITKASSISKSVLIERMLYGKGLEAVDNAYHQLKAIYNSWTSQQIIAEANRHEMKIL